MMALARIREVYGIRRTEFNQANKTVRIEYDATRLTEPVVHQLLRRSGLEIIERVSLTPDVAIIDLPAPVQVSPQPTTIKA